MCATSHRERQHGMWQSSVQSGRILTDAHVAMGARRSGKKWPSVLASRVPLSACCQVPAGAADARRFCARAAALRPDTPDGGSETVSRYFFQIRVSTFLRLRILEYIFIIIFIIFL